MDKLKIAHIRHRESWNERVPSAYCEVEGRS